MNDTTGTGKERTMIRKATCAMAVAAMWAGGATATDAGTALALMGSARSAALGGGAVAAARGADALGANPAGLAGAVRPAVLGTWMRGDAGLAVGRLAAAAPLGTLALGASVGGLSAGEAEAVDGGGAVRLVDAQRDVTATAGAALRLGGGLAAGASAGWYRSRLAEAWTASVATADAGLRWESADGRATLGAAWLNAGGRLRYDAAGAALPSRGAVGAAWKPVAGRRADLLLAADMEFRPDGRRGAGLGAELGLAGRLALRAGVRQDETVVTRSAGVGIRAGGVRLDVAVAGAAGAPAASRATLEVAL